MSREQDIPAKELLDELLDQAVQDGYISVIDTQGTGQTIRLTDRGARRVYLLSECLGIADEIQIDPVSAGISLVAYGRADLTS